MTASAACWRHSPLRVQRLKRVGFFAVERGLTTAHRDAAVHEAGNCHFLPFAQLKSAPNSGHSAQLNRQVQGRYNRSLSATL